VALGNRRRRYHCSHSVSAFGMPGIRARWTVERHWLRLQFHSRQRHFAVFAILCRVSYMLGSSWLSPQSRGRLDHTVVRLVLDACLLAPAPLRNPALGARALRVLPLGPGSLEAFHHSTVVCFRNRHLRIAAGEHVPIRLSN